MASRVGELAVTVGAAEGIQASVATLEPPTLALLGNQDVYAVAILGGGAGEHKAATNTAMKGGTHPQWNETLHLPLVLAGDVDAPDLELQLWNQNRAAPDSLVGSGVLPVADAVRAGGKAVEVEVPMTSFPSKKREGQVYLQLRFLELDPATVHDPGQAGIAREEPTMFARPDEPLPEVPRVQPTTEAALQPPEASDLRPLDSRERGYDRVHRPGYNVPGSQRT